MIETRYDPEADVLQISFGPASAVYDSAGSRARCVCRVRQGRPSDGRGDRQRAVDSRWPPWRAARLPIAE
jgi:hypothetical protein